MCVWAFQSQIDEIGVCIEKGESRLGEKFRGVNMRQFCVLEVERADTG